MPKAKKKSTRKAARAKEVPEVSCAKPSGEAGDLEEDRPEVHSLEHGSTRRSKSAISAAVRGRRRHHGGPGPDEEKVASSPCTATTTNR